MSRRHDPLVIDEAARASLSTISLTPASTSTRSVLKTYRLTSLDPKKWEDVGTEGDEAIAGLSAGGGRGDEPDPLALKRGTVLTGLDGITPEVKTNILLHSKAFDPKLFLATVHPQATFRDLSVGRDRLRDALESRSEALKVLVEEEFDRFANVKGITMAVYDEMKEGPLADDNEYGIKGVKEGLKLAAGKAEQVYTPVLDAQLKADRLRSTLSVFERSKFFFNLPGVLLEAIEAGRYDTALRAYRRGKDLDTRPHILLGLPAGTTISQQQAEQAKRIYDKVWTQVEKIISDLRTTLAKRLRDTRRGLAELEKTIEILLELDPKDDPVWIFFDTQHQRILQTLQAVHSISAAKFKGISLRHGAALSEAAVAQDLRECVASLFSLEPDLVYERSAGVVVWKGVIEVAKNLSESLMASLPSFWKVARGFMSGKYSKRDLSTSTSRRSPAECRAMTSDIVSLFITLLSQFFELDAPLHEGDAVVLPAFVSHSSSAMTAAFYMARVLSDLNELFAEVGALALLDSDYVLLKEFMSKLRTKFTHVVIMLWVRDAKQLFRLENWVPDPEEPSTTLYLRRAAAFQRSLGQSTLNLAGGSDSRDAPYPASLRKGEEGVPQHQVARIQAAYVDALYGFLDGLVHVAFSAPSEIDAADEDEPTVIAALTGRNIQIQDVDTRIMLTVSNLSHLKKSLLAKMIQEFEAIFGADLKSDLHTLLDVLKQLDKILFEDYIKRKSAEIGAIIRQGVLGGSIDWLNMSKPTEVQHYIYKALLSLVLVHAQVNSTARPLVHRTLSALVDELALEALESFKQVHKIGLGGMLQATLEIEFLHQTLEAYVSNTANARLQEVYGTISAACYRRTAKEDTVELQRELEQLKRTLVASKRATTLDFLCFKPTRKREDAK